jgi:hypothetical protein
MKRFSVTYKLEGTAIMQCGFEVSANSKEELEAILKAKPWHEWRELFFKPGVPANENHYEFADEVDCFEPGSEAQELNVVEIGPTKAGFQND